MARIQVRFRVRKKYSVDGDKYRIRTLSVSDDIISNHTSLVTTAEEMVRKEFSDDCIKLMWLRIIKQKDGKSK